MRETQMRFSNQDDLGVEPKIPHQVTRFLLQKLKKRYLNNSKYNKGLILNEFCATTGLTRKHSIRALNGVSKFRRHRPGPKRLYDSEVQKHVINLWEASGRLCSKKMVKAIEKWLPFYPVDVSIEVRSLLLQISSSTIDRILKNHRQEKIARGQSTTSPSPIKSRFPFKVLDLPILEPGFVEADTVAHCGSSLEGDFINSLTVTDIFSGWTEVRAVWGKNGRAIMDAVDEIENTLPFKIKVFASDSGSEFLNNDLWNHFQDREVKIPFVRGRPKMKNDNAHVEQRNWTHVRQLLGYDRLDNNRDLTFINDLYKNYWLILWNFFTPVMKLKSKTQDGQRVIKVHDQPKTPYDRLLDSKLLSQHEEGALKARMQSFNPFHIKAEMDKSLKRYFKIIDTRKNQLAISETVKCSFPYNLPINSTGEMTAH